MGIFGFGREKGAAPGTKSTPPNLNERVDLTPEEARELRDKYKVPFDGDARMGTASKIENSAPVNGDGTGGLETEDMDPANRRGISPPMAA